MPTHAATRTRCRLRIMSAGCRGLPDRGSDRRLCARELGRPRRCQRRLGVCPKQSRPYPFLSVPRYLIAIGRGPSWSGTTGDKPGCGREYHFATEVPHPIAAVRLRPGLTQPCRSSLLPPHAGSADTSVSKHAAAGARRYRHCSNVASHEAQVLTGPVRPKPLVVCQRCDCHRCRADVGLVAETWPRAC
jgi:hypothetical protein